MANNQAAKLIKQKQMIETELRNFVTVISVEAKNHFTKSFADQGFTDKGLVKWQPRKSRSRDDGRAILVKTGNLRRSIRVISRSINEVVIGSDLPYAQVHNEGGRTRRGRMPKRQFIGESAVLNRKILARLDRIIQRIFR